MKFSRDAVQPIDIQRMSNAAAAVERIALNNKQLLEQQYGTTSSDVFALVQYARAHWYQENSKGKGK